MMRPILVVLGLGGTLLMSMNAEAQTTNPGSDDVRYSYNRVDNGFLRLDMRSGEVSLCSPAAGRWSCEPVPDVRRALGNDIERLELENAALKKALLDHGLPLPNGIQTETSGSSAGSSKTDSSKTDSGTIDSGTIDNGTIDRGKNGDQAVKLLNDATVALRVIVVRLWRELVVMIMNLEHGVQKKT